MNRIGIQVRELDPATNRFVETLEFALGGEVPAQFAAVQGQADTRLRIALAEGVTSWQVVQGLNAVEPMTGSVAALPGEGRLAPDSYEIRPGDDRGDLVAQMETRQRELLETAWAARATDQQY